MSTSANWIDTAESLAVVCKALDAQSVIALDTECVRERTYYPVASLLQVATPDEIFLIDLTACDDYQPVCKVLQNPKLIKLMHAATQDHQILKQIGCTIKMPFFDTQIATAFAGLGQQIGYKDLIEELLGVTLKKDQSRSDWLQRPLSDEQLAYAADDVRYLLEAFEELKRRLEKDHKWEWFVDESQRSLESNLVALEIDPAEMKIKVSHRSSIRYQYQNQRLDELVAWREHKAQEIDRPRRWVISDRRLVALASLDSNHKKRKDELTDCFSSRYRSSWRREIDAILQRIQPTDERVKRRVASVTMRKKVDDIMKMAQVIADRHDLDRSLVLTRKDITQLVVHKDRAVRERISQGWRKPLLQEIASALDS